MLAIGSRQDFKGGPFAADLNNIIEQDHRRIKHLTRPGLGFGGFWTARRTLMGFEAMAVIRKGQIRNIGGHGIRVQAEFIDELFRAPA